LPLCVEGVPQPLGLTASAQAREARAALLLMQVRLDLTEACLAVSASSLAVT
jgi:hypothetical protein